MAYSSICTEAPFDVVVNYEETATTSITINTSTLTKEFTPLQANKKIFKDNSNILIGSFTVTVTSGSSDTFDVKVFTTSSYVYDSNQFLALSNNPDVRGCKIALFSNKTPSGTEESYQIYNDSVVISTSQSLLSEDQIVVTAYILPGQIASLVDSTCQIPMFFKIEGA